jgi:hypothetical protein
MISGVKMGDIRCKVLAVSHLESFPILKVTGKAVQPNVDIFNFKRKKFF